MNCPALLECCTKWGIDDACLLEYIEVMWQMGITNSYDLFNVLLKLTTNKRCKFCLTGLWWEKFTDCLWILLTKGQRYGKCFKGMTSSWSDEVVAGFLSFRFRMTKFLFFSMKFGDGENVPDIPAHAQPAILRIWLEAHGHWVHEL